MSLNIDWVGLAEGATQDLRGNMALVGFNPRALPVEMLPAQLVPTFIVAIDDDEDPAPVLVAGTNLHSSLTVVGPQGETLFFADMPGSQAPPKRRDDVPGRLVLAVQAAFTAEKAGRYSFRFSFRVEGRDDQRLDASKEFWVVEPPPSEKLP